MLSCLDQVFELVSEILTENSKMKPAFHCDTAFLSLLHLKNINYIFVDHGRLNNWDEGFSVTYMALLMILI